MIKINRKSQLKKMCFSSDGRILHLKYNSIRKTLKISEKDFDTMPLFMLKDLVNEHYDEFKKDAIEMIRSKKIK